MTAGSGSCTPGPAAMREPADLLTGTTHREGPWRPDSPTACHWAARVSDRRFWQVPLKAVIEIVAR